MKKKNHASKPKPRSAPLHQPEATSSTPKPRSASLHQPEATPCSTQAILVILAMENRERTENKGREQRERTEKRGRAEEKKLKRQYFGQNERQREKNGLYRRVKK